MAIQLGGELLRTIPHLDGDQPYALATSEITTGPAPSAYIYQMLDSSGAGTATTQMVAGTATYKITPPAGSLYAIQRLNIYIEDNGAWRGDRYGASAALTNGIIVTVENGTGTIANMTPQPIKTLGHWGLCAGVDMAWSNFSAGNDIALVRWTFARGAGAVILNGDNGEFLQMSIRDNLAAGGADLVSHLGEVQGQTYTL